MNIDAQVMGDAVHVIGSDFLRAVNQPKLHAALCQNLLTDLIQPAQRDAGSGCRGDGAVGGKNHLVNRSLTGCKNAVYRIGSGNIGTVSLNLRAEIQQKQRSVLAGIPVRFVMKHGPVGPASRNGGERCAVRAQIMNHVFKIRLRLILLHSRFQMTHHILQRPVRDGDRLPDQRHLILVLLRAESRDHRKNISDRHARIFLSELPRPNRIIIGQILRLMAVAVKIQGIHNFSGHDAADAAFKCIRIGDLINSGNLLRFLRRHHFSRPADRIGVKCRNVERCFSLFSRLIHDEDHPFPAKACQIEKISVGLKGRILVRADMALDPRKQNQNGMLLHFFIYLLPSHFIIHSFSPSS